MAPIGASFLSLIGWPAPGSGALTRLMNTCGLISCSARNRSPSAPSSPSSMITSPVSSVTSRPGGSSRTPVTSQRSSYPLQRAAQQLLGSGEFAERRRVGVGAVIQIEVAALVQLDLYRIHPIVAGESPDGPAAGEPLVHSNVKAGRRERARHEPHRRWPCGFAVPVAEDDIAIQPDAEAVQVQQEEAREPGKQPLDHRVKRVVETRVSDPDPVADLVAGERPLVDGPASRHPGADDPGPEAAMLPAVRAPL